MKNKLSFFFMALAIPMTSLAASDTVEAIKNGPQVICKDHPDNLNCQNAINNLIIAVKNLSQLNEVCESSTELKDKMDASTKKQCETAKEVTNYISGMSLKR